MTNIFDRTCVWCGEVFELEAYDNDVESFSKDMKSHQYYCKERPEDEELVKKIIKAIKGKDLKESQKIIKEIMNLEVLNR